MTQTVQGVVLQRFLSLSEKRFYYPGEAYTTTPEKATEMAKNGFLCLPEDLTEPPKEKAVAAAKTPPKRKIKR